MLTVEERLAHVEGRVVEQANAFVEIREAVRHLEQRMDARFDQIERKFLAVDARFEAIEQKISHQFLWLVGVQITTLIAVVGALIARP